MTAKKVILFVSVVFFHLGANAKLLKIYYAPIRGEFVVVQSKVHTTLTDVKDPNDLSVFIGPAHRVMEQPIANRRSQSGSSNLRVYLRSGPMLLFKIDPFGLAPRYHYDDPDQAHSTSYSWGHGPHEELIELEVDEFDLTHRLNLITLETYKQPGTNANNPTVSSILKCNALIDAASGAIPKY